MRTDLRWSNALIFPNQTLWRCYAAEKPDGCAATWKMYVLTPEAVAMAESDNSSPNIRKLNLSVINQLHLNFEPMWSRSSYFECFQVAIESFLKNHSEILKCEVGFWHGWFEYDYVHSANVSLFFFHLLHCQTLVFVFPSNVKLHPGAL